MNLSLQVFCDASKSSYARQDFRLPIILVLPSNHPVVKALIIYKHVHVKPISVSEGLLLRDRVRNAAVFEIIGLDLAGPFILKNGEKNLILILTCAVYSAIHLELLTTVSTESFLLGLRRFIARRGRPSVIYSDNCTHFKDDVEDLEPLTPAMFLQDIREDGVPELNQIDENKLNEILVYRNRVRFRVEYLGQLRETRNIKWENILSEGDIVLVGDDHTKRLNWNLGKILKLYPSKDEKVNVTQRAMVEPGAETPAGRNLFDAALFQCGEAETLELPDILTSDGELEQPDLDDPVMVDS
ncbi:uncharacterized protein TNCV_1502341 [Trichonephila clavipes]|uniref:DUF5641 domain-containing protein n=1 Tax=Trichonephila clavipes TaxID=2585209 RepID=A0A8X6UZD9_TRICX|nr:uncharacterized protein TNCV_1502341 [Trichonephila clavipes]